jgi:type IV pilus assembly protein PilA
MNARRRGFTLVELMIVVAIIGVLAALAIYGVARYLKHAKTAEATRSLGAIETGSRSQYQLETPYLGNTDLFVHTYCPDTALTPSVVPDGKKLLVPPTQWNSPGWACLKFAMTDPQFYAYRYVTNQQTGTAATFTATAQGDLDGNTITSLFELTGRGGAMGDSVREGMRVVNEDE